MSSASKSAGTVIESREDYKDTPRGKYNYWSDELRASMKMLKGWHKDADCIVNRYLGKVTDSTRTLDTHREGNRFMLNLFHSNVVTLESMLYGNTPQIDVSRRYAQPDDDVGRVAAEMMERLLNLDMSQNTEELECVFKSVLQDRLTSGLGCARIRYDVQYTDDGQMLSEDAPIDYYFWSDVLWGWARNWSEIPWVAFRNYLTKDEIRERWGDKAADNVQLRKQRSTGSDEDASSDPDTDSAWMKAEVWEVWDKQTRTVRFVSLGYERVLEDIEDPLKLQKFFPTPPFMIANPTTMLYMPTPDFKLAQDLYNEIDTLQTRISIITEAVRVVGVYNAASEEVKRMMNEGEENSLIPVENWAMFGESGGLKGVIDWFPIMDVVGALDKLRDVRAETMGLLQQVTGMADVMQGGLENQYEGVGQSQIKAKFGSTRIQKLQDQFAQFASGIMQLKAEVISKHFEPQTIVSRANMQFSMDKELIPQAVELIKRPTEAKLRVVIRPESVAMIDYAELQNERTGYINALATFMQSAGPMMDQDPSAKPFLLQLLQWGMAGFKGASEIEGVIDKAIEASMKEAENPQPDPEQQAMQMQMQMEQQKAQVELQKITAKAEADMQLREQDRQADIETAAAQHQMKMAEVQATMQAKLAEIEAKMQSDVLAERIQSETNVQQAQATAGAELQKDMVSTELEIEKEAAKTALKIQELAASTDAKIREANAKPAPSKSSD